MDDPLKPTMVIDLTDFDQESSEIASPKKINKKTSSPKTVSKSPEKSTLAQPDPFNNLKKIGRYEIVQELGRGTAGVVYRAKDPNINRDVAIKLSQPSEGRFRESFFVEAQAAGHLKHPNIISIYDFDVFQDYCFIAMEYVSGTTLQEYCNPKKLLPVRKSLEIIYRVSRALNYAHFKGVVHLDIKPSNIMLDKDETPKVMDFGIAQQGEKREGTIIAGTPFYIAPERLMRKVVGPHSDLFSLGCVFYEIITGQKPFWAENLEGVIDKILHKQPPKITRLRPEVPEELEQVIMTTLSKDPADRYPTGDDLAYQIKRILRSIGGQVSETRDVLDYLLNSNFFHGFTRSQARELLKCSNIFRVRQGRVIIKEGDVDDTFYIILSGQVAVQKHDRKIATIGEGECFGEMAFLNRGVRAASIAADTDCTLVKISSTLFDRTSDSIQLMFYQRFAKSLAARLSKSSSMP